MSKGVVRCENWPRYIQDVSILIKQIESRQFFAHRQKCRDISSMPTAARYELAITIGYRVVTNQQLRLASVLSLHGKTDVLLMSGTQTILLENTTA